MVFSRLAGTLMVMPGFAVQGVPTLVRVAIAVSLTALIAPVVPVYPEVLNPTLQVLVVAMIGEVGLGVLLGGAVGMVFGGLVFATEVIGSQTGRVVALQFNLIMNSKK